MANLLIIVGVIFAVLQACLKGYIKTESTAAIILLATVFLLAARRSIIAKLLVVSVPIYFFAKEYGFFNLRDFTSLLFAILPLLIMLFGFYIIFKGIFK